MVLYGRGKWSESRLVEMCGIYTTICSFQPAPDLRHWENEKIEHGSFGVVWTEFQVHIISKREYSSSPNPDN